MCSGKSRGRFFPQACEKHIHKDSPDILEEPYGGYSM